MHKERRNNRRTTAAGPLRFCCSDPNNKARPSGNLPDAGIMLNQSDSGVCFISTCPIEVGRSLLINCPWISDRSESGTVRWCQQAAIDLWRVGLEKS